MAWNTAATPQKPLAMVKRSARWNSRTIEKWRRSPRAPSAMTPGAPWRPSALRLVREAEPVALAHDATERRRREMRGAHEHVALAVALEERAARGRRLLGIEVGARDPLGLEELHGRVDQVARDDAVRAARAEAYADVVRRVSRRRLQPDLVADPVVVLDHDREAGLDDRDHAVADLVLRRLLVQTRPVRPLLLGHDVL